LSVEQRTVVILTYVHGYKYEEIAKILGRPTNTIKTRMRAARTRLQAVYGNDAVTE
jgi:DNA-directed RNA polymerase specialized sigma24 family protein